MEIDIENHLDEVSTDALLKELKKRDGLLIKSILRDRMTLEQVESFGKLSKLGQFKVLLELKPYATKAEIINEINEL